jgi:spore maturation protein CgeB
LSFAELTTKDNVKFLICDTKSGLPGLKIEKSSRALQVHSLIDPEQEAGRQLAKSGIKAGDLVVIFGGGLGYLENAVRAITDLNPIVIEPDKNALNTALQKFNLSDQIYQRSTALCGTAETVIDEITRAQIKSGWSDIFLIVNPAYQQCWPDWAEKLLQGFSPGRNVSMLSKAFRSAAWSGKRVLIIQSGYFLMRECISAFKQNNVEIAEVPLNNSGHLISPTAAHRPLDPGNDFMERLLETLVEFKPEFVFSVNHIGFDAEGKLLDLLDALNIPLCVWYVDSPGYILEKAASVVRQSTFLFCWERAWIEPMRKLGFEHVSHLPLAGNESFIDTTSDWSYDFGFVGGSNAVALRKWRSKLGLPQKYHAVYAQLLKDYCNSGKNKLPGKWLREEIKIQPALNSWLNEKKINQLESLLVLEATRIDRLALVQQFKTRNFSLHGDADWMKLDMELPWKPPLDYYTELPGFYASCRVSLNCTSRQMPGGVNQRVFDAPLCGSLPLNDFKEDLELLFEPGRDCIYYRESHDLLETADKLIKDPTWRLSLLTEARKTIIDRHLYRHRISEILTKMSVVLS